MTAGTLRLYAAGLAVAVLFSTSAATAQPAPEPMPQPAPAPAPEAAPAPQVEQAPEPEPMEPPAPMAQPPVQPQQQQQQPDMGGHRVQEQTNRHALGISGGLAPGSGFAYRRYIGNTMLQGVLFAMITNRGKDATVWGGLSAAQYLLVWHEDRRASVLPDTSALRLVGGVSYLYDRTTDTFFDDLKVNPNCVDTATQSCARSTKEVNEISKTHWISAGIGIGFEFGAIMRPGFSVSLDLALTAMFDQNGLQQLWPLPALALMYSW
ncbi:MAG: hypothetical protein H6747_02260 [Deltaproteobacteria bacterium]|nr:hypothetical protein [Deltaproteobacteria bacterium]